MRPLDGLFLFAVRHADFHAAIAAAALAIAGREVHHVHLTIAGACRFCTKQDLVAGYRRIHCWMARPAPPELTPWSSIKDMYLTAYSLHAIL